jgi:phosphoglycolate phosphatase
MFQNVKAVIFDFDYTLADSSKGIIACANFALTGMGSPPASEESIRRTIGLSLTATYEALTGDSRHQQAAEFSELFIRHASEVMVRETILFDTVRPAVAVLKKRGLRLGIVSTKFRYRIEQILDRDGLGTCFDAIVGGEDVTAHKPDPAGLLAALDHLRCAREEALYVGDTIIDAETSRRAQVAFVAVLSGVTPKEAFQGLGVQSIVDSLSHLPDMLI